MGSLFCRFVCRLRSLLMQHSKSVRCIYTWSLRLCCVIFATACRFMKEEARRCELLVGSGCVCLVNFEPLLRRVVATCKQEAAEVSVRVAVQFSKGFPLQRAKLVLPAETVPGGHATHSAAAAAAASL